MGLAFKLAWRYVRTRGAQTGKRCYGCYTATAAVISRGDQSRV